MIQVKNYLSSLNPIQKQSMETNVHVKASEMINRIGAFDAYLIKLLGNPVKLENKSQY